MLSLVPVVTTNVVRMRSLLAEGSRFLTWCLQQHPDEHVQEMEPESQNMYDDTLALFSLPLYYREIVSFPFTW